ncbi:MAG: hypothetical protein NT045_05445, partial [Candidatus Aureabacteria bacterium]|nr:hypothetical protein [Candidatus Auribacterota bacterium]
QTLEGQKKIELTITGRGQDGRCRWCRTFRSGLRTAVRRDYGKEAFVLNGSCMFDTAPSQTACSAVAK